MVGRVKGMCRDPTVEVLGLEDDLVPESDDFMLGKVRTGCTRKVNVSVRSRPKSTAADTAHASVESRLR